jgi:hypothetical protein
VAVVAGALVISAMRVLGVLWPLDPAPGSA